MITTYRGEVSGAVSGVQTTATIEVEIDGTPSAGSTVRGRVRLMSDPAGYPVERERWSRWYTGNIGGKPFSANVATAELAGKIVIDWHDGRLSVAVDGFAAAPIIGTLSILARGDLVKTGERAGEPAAPAPVKPAGPVDAIAITEWRLLGKHKIDPRKMAITRQLKGAKNLGGEVRLSFEPLGWSTKTGKQGKTVDGGVCIIWRDGDGFTGGLFDWHGLHQTTKTQNNIPGGYLDGRQPPKGAPIWYFICDLGFDQRTTIAAGGTW